VVWASFNTWRGSLLICGVGFFSYVMWVSFDTQVCGSHWRPLVLTPNTSMNFPVGTICGVGLFSYVMWVSFDTQVCGLHWRPLVLTPNTSMNFPVGTTKRQRVRRIGRLQCDAVCCKVGVAVCCRQLYSTFRAGLRRHSAFYLRAG